MDDFSFYYPFNSYLFILPPTNRRHQVAKKKKFGTRMIEAAPSPLSGQARICNFDPVPTVTSELQACPRTFAREYTYSTWQTSVTYWHRSVRLQLAGTDLGSEAWVPAGSTSRPPHTSPPWSSPPGLTVQEERQCSVNVFLMGKKYI